MEFDPIDTTDDAMCLAHITDEHLGRRVEEYATPGRCAACEAEGLTPSGPVVNLEHVARVVDAFAGRSYDHEGFVVDGEQAFDPVDIEEVTANLLANSVEPEVLDYVSTATAALIHVEQDWYVPFDSDREAGVEMEWDGFEESIKHESRLLSQPTKPQPDRAPERNFMFVKSLLVLTEERNGLVKTMRRGTKLYRARSERDSRELEKQAQDAPASQLGPAPREKASAGRMNAQGVPLFYVAQDAETACAEVASHSPYDEAVVGTFILQQPLRILDLTTVPPPRSIFDDAPYEAGDEHLTSLGYYVERITRPVIIDGNHPVDYAPTQVLTDAIRHWSRPALDGIAYPSRVRDGGVNVVLFFGEPLWFEEVGKPSSRFARFQRGHKRGSSAALFVIDPKTVRRYRVKRALTVERTRRWEL